MLAWAGSMNELILSWHDCLTAACVHVFDREGIARIGLAFDCGVPVLTILSLVLYLAYGCRLWCARVRTSIFDKFTLLVLCCASQVMARTLVDLPPRFFNASSLQAAGLLDWPLPAWRTVVRWLLMHTHDKAFRHLQIEARRGPAGLVVTVACLLEMAQHLPVSSTFCTHFPNFFFFSSQTLLFCAFVCVCVCV
jgi:hypothetical protein